VFLNLFVLHNGGRNFKLFLRDNVWFKGGDRLCNLWSLFLTSLLNNSFVIDCLRLYNSGAKFVSANHILQNVLSFGKFLWMKMGHNRPLSKHQWVPFRRYKLSQILCQQPSEFTWNDKLVLLHTSYFSMTTLQKIPTQMEWNKKKKTFLNKMSKFAHKFE
jgi:hypothetical protein